jgi:pSer/pThr/pTyr-binding forkhead associated (FHA) protein
VGKWLNPPLVILDGVTECTTLHGYPNSALLVVKREQNARSRFLIASDTQTTTLGRHPTNDVFLDDVTVSRRHAELRRRQDILCLHDLGSLNITYLNRERIEESELASGEERQIGRFKLTFLIGE